MAQTPLEAIPVNDKRLINGWAMFDWANSAYALVITTAIYPLYFNGVVSDDPFRFLGIEVTDSSLFSYSISFAYLIIVLILPILSGIADYGGRKKFFMQVFTTIGSFACISLYFFEDMDTLLIGVLGFIFAMIGFASGQVFYNSYLPLIASEDQYDRVSAKGFSYGYIGSVLLLIFNLFMIEKFELFGFPDKKEATRVVFILVGLWWIGFAQITFRRLPKERKVKGISKLISKGYNEIKNVWFAIKEQRNTKRFLLAFFAYAAGVQTILYLASTFATDELDFAATDLILLVLLLQILAIVGALLFSRISAWKGNKFSLIIMLVTWMGICGAAYLTYEKNTFYIIAGFVGLVMGGIQSMSRSTYSKLIPQNTTDTASYFSFYDVVEKLAIVIGTFSFGIIDQLMGGMRNSILTLGVYFFIGLLILLTVKIKSAKVVSG